MATNLPSPNNTDSATPTKLYFENYGVTPLSFPAAQVDACLTFFKQRGFDEDAAAVTSATLLKQSKADGVSIFTVLDSLKGYGNLEISAVVAKILNNNRPSTSTLGYKVETPNITKTRNIAP